MLRIIYKSIKEYKLQFILTIILTAIQSFIFIEIPYVLSFIIDKGIMLKNYAGIKKYCIFLIILLIAGLTVGIAKSYFFTRSSVGFKTNIRAILFEKIQTFSLKDIFDFENSGIITRITRDINWISNSYESIVGNLVPCIFEILFAFFVINTTNKSMSKLFFVVIPFLIILMVLAFYYILKLLKRILELYDLNNKLTSETINGIRTIKTFNAQAFQMKKFRNLIDEFFIVDFKVVSMFMCDYPFLMMFIGAITTAFVYFGGSLVIDKKLEVGFLIATITYCQLIISNIFFIMYSFFSLFRAQKSIVRIKQIINREPDIKENINSKKHLDNFDIEFDNVNFSYFNSNDSLAIENINFKIKHGENIGIIGGTGSGKSSLVYLIQRLYDTTRGSVKIGGIDVKNIDLSYLRSIVCVVLQKVYLFKGSIRENMHMANPKCSDEEILKILDGVNALDFASNLDYKIEENAANLSGGQKQRLSIARALIRNPKIFIFDDTTSAIDTKTDKNIREYLNNNFEGTTKIYISQRILTVKDCDKIIVLDNGKIIDIGNHDYLLKNNTIYKEIYDSQQGGNFDE